MRYGDVAGDDSRSRPLLDELVAATRSASSTCCGLASKRERRHRSSATCWMSSSGGSQADRLLQAGRTEAAVFELKRVLGMKPDAPLAVRDTLEGVVQTRVGRGAAGPRHRRRSSNSGLTCARRRPASRSPTRRSTVPQREGRFDVSLFANYMRMDAGFPQRGFGPTGGLERVRGQFNYVAAGAMVTIPILNRNQGEVAVARAERAGAAAAYEAARLAAEAGLASRSRRDERAQRGRHDLSSGRAGPGAPEPERRRSELRARAGHGLRGPGRTAAIPGCGTRVYRRLACGVRGANGAQPGARRRTMTSESRVTMHTGVAALVAVAFLLAAGAGSHVPVMRTRCVPTVLAMPPPDSVPVAPADDDVLDRRARCQMSSFTLSPDAVATRGDRRRAGRVQWPPQARFACPESSSRMPIASRRDAARRRPRDPSVEPSSATACGRARRWPQIYSPELAEAQTRYISARAMLDAHDRELQRTQKLVEIGAASRQELERIHAEHAAQTAEVQSARARARSLLGVSASACRQRALQDKAVIATTNVPAPIDGVVTERLANVGLNVDTGDEAVHRRRSFDRLGGRGSLREGLLACARRQLGRKSRRRPIPTSRCTAASATSIRRSVPRHGRRRCGSRCQIRAASCASGCTRMS